jgi:ribonuclease HII
MDFEIKIEDIDSIKDKSFAGISEYIDVLKNKYMEFALRDMEFRKMLQPLMADTRKNVQNLAVRTESFIEKREKEISRVRSMYDFDRSYVRSGLLCGVDEVGRGPLAGPIVAAAVVLDLENLNNRDLILGIKDSKKLSSKQREELSGLIKNKCVSYSIAEIDNYNIDTKGIAWCNNEVFKISVKGLSIQPQLVLSDGYRIKDINLPNQHVIKGDEKSASIACASIIAKVYRDQLMKELSKTYPQYAFDSNAGYGSQEHIEALKKYGITNIHRKSFLTNIVKL